MDITTKILSEAGIDYQGATDLDGKRRAIIKGLWNLLDVIPSKEAKILLKAALQPFIAVRCGRRHILTSLPDDAVPKNPQIDPHRDRARELGAAIVQYFAFQTHYRPGRVIAKRVSEAMGRGGLLIERNRNRGHRSSRLAPPSVETILADRRWAFNPKTRRKIRPTSSEGRSDRSTRIKRPAFFDQFLKQIEQDRTTHESEKAHLEHWLITLESICRALPS